MRSGSKGDAAAVAGTRLQELHVLMAPELLNYFARRVSPPDDAADLLAETFLIAWRRLTRLPPSEEEGRMWMYGIARNALRNWLRGQRRRHSLGEDLRTELARSRQELPAVDTAVSHQRDVRDALTLLPSNQRELMLLIHWDGFTLPQAAQLVGCSESTARGRYQRATLLLRKHLSDYDTRAILQQEVVS